MLKNAPVFKEKLRKYYNKIRNLALSILVIPVLYLITIYIIPDNKTLSSIVLLILLIYMILFFVFFDRALKEKPAFKEYVLHYFWQGKYYLDKYSNQGASEKDAKTSLSFFKKLDTKLFRNISTVKPYRFETEEKMNQSIVWLEKWVSNYVIDSLNKRKSGINKKVEEVFKGTFEFIIDENFNGLCVFLKPYVKPYLKKSDIPIINFFYWLHSSHKRCIIFYGGLFTSIIIIAAYSIYYYYGLEILFGVFTVISVIGFFLGIIRSYFNKRFLSKDKN